MKELYIKSISGDSNKLGEVSNLWKESCIQYGTRHERSLKLANYVHIMLIWKSMVCKMNS